MQGKIAVFVNGVWWLEESDITVVSVMLTKKFLHRIKEVSGGILFMMLFGTYHTDTYLLTYCTLMGAVASKDYVAASRKQCQELGAELL